MSSSTAEPTRFTATSPHANSGPSPPVAPFPAQYAVNPPTRSQPAPPQPPPRSSHPSRVPRQSNPNNPQSRFSIRPGSNETPIQKVARLRAERNKMLAAQITLWDRIVDKGRIVADKAHRITVGGLLIFSVLVAGVAVVSITDMIIFNRKKRKVWYAAQALDRQNALMLAIEHERNGLPLSEEEVLVLKDERDRFNEAEERARKSKERWEYLNVKRWLTSGLKAEEEPAGQAVEEANEPTEARLQESSESEPNGLGGVLAAVENSRRVEEKRLEAEGSKSSALDRMAARAAELGKGKSWWVWGNGKE
ncbi:hypothetical protein MMC07_003419 [Pseudocyphellaria aurata]|nr:hypothetical protein [Pseudocyphellaria aurata]